jgi:AraC family transcriptional regulator, transcriptional activator of pobA
MLMRTEACRVWEPADLFVDKRINPENCHVWPFADSFAIDVRFLVLDRRSIPLHRPDHLEVVLFESGEQLYEIGNNTCTLTKGDIIIVGNRLSHRCLPVASSRPPAYSTVLSFLPRTVHSGIPFGDDLQYLMPFNLQSPSVPNVIRANPALSGEIRELIEKIRVEVPASTEFSQLAIRTYLKMILLRLLNHCSEIVSLRRAFALQQESSARLAPIFAYIKEHADEPIRIKDAARMCAASPCSFMNLFKQVTGQSFVAYLNAFRVKKAQDLLVNTNKSIAEISLEVGFCNQSYFTVVFRQIVGETPLAFRLENTQAESRKSRRPSDSFSIPVSLPS